MALYLRRMFLLFAFGALQSVFLGWTSILEDYAIIGCMLLLLRRVPVRGILVTTLVVLSLAEFAGPINQMLRPGAGAQSRALRRQRVERMNEAKKSATYREFVPL